MAGFLFFRYTKLKNINDTGWPDYSFVNMNYAFLDPSTKSILKIIFAVLVLGFLWIIRDILLLLVLSVILASALEPLVGYLKLKRIPRPVTVLAVYIVVLGLAALVLSLIVPPAVSELNNLQNNLPQISAELREKIPFLKVVFGGVNFDLSSIIRQFLSSVSGEGSLFSRTVGVFNGMFSFITVLVISFYLVAEQRGMKNFINSLVPARHQELAMNLVTKIQQKMGLWVLGQLILSVFIFVLTFIGLTILGVKYALFLALLAGLLEIIPYLGPIISAIPAVFFALLQSPTLVIGVIILYIVVQKTEGYVLVPKIMERTVGISPLIVLVALLVGFKLAGILGLLIAVPLVSAITAVVQELSANQDSHNS